jgi:hypothetical protein
MEGSNAEKSRPLYEKFEFSYVQAEFLESERRCCSRIASNYGFRGLLVEIPVMGPKL